MSKITPEDGDNLASVTLAQTMAEGKNWRLYPRTEEQLRSWVSCVEVVE